MKRIAVFLITTAAAALIGCEKDPFIGPYESFFRTYQGNGDLIGREVISSSSSGSNRIVVCGYGKGSNSDDDLFLFFLDTVGNEISRKFIGTNGNDQCWSFTKANDGGYVIAGWSDVNNPGVSNDILIVKTDADGNQQWTQLYGGSNNDLATHIIAVSDGYLVCGIKGENADENSWILRLNNSGDSIWSFTHGGNQPDGAMRICDNGDNTFAITGYTNSSGNGSTDGYVLILNDAGSMLGYYPFGTPEYEEPHDIEKLNDGWVITGHAGTTDITTHNVFLQFVDADGTAGNYFTYGGSAHDGAESMVVFHDKVHIVGRSSTRDPLQDAIYIETDLAGNQLKKEWIGTPNEDPAFGLFVDSRQVIITGYAMNPTTGRKDLLVLRK